MPRLSIFLILLVLAAQAETIFPHRDRTPEGDKISWFGTTTVFVGHYEWPKGIKPLGTYNQGNSLVAQADYPNIVCEVSTDICRIAGPLPFGGLPDGTAVKFVTTETLPGGLVPWSQDESKTYYIRDGADNGFKLAETPDGPPVALDDEIAGSGTHGMSFAGYSHVISYVGAIARSRVACDPQTDVCTSETPHSLVTGSWIHFHSTDSLPIGLRVFWDSSYEPYCAVVLSPTQFKVQRKASLYAGCETATLVDIRDAGKGIHYIYQRTGTNVHVSLMTGYPPGTVLSWRGNTTSMLAWPTVGTYSETNAASHTVTLYAKVPAVTPPGDYTVTVNTVEDRSSNSNPASFTYTLHAVPITPVNKEGPAIYPPIPGLSSSVISGRPYASWENIMTSSSNGGGSSMPMAQFPRCPNRASASAPQWYNLPAAQDAAVGSDMVQATWIPHIDLTHKLGTTNLRYRCYRGGGPWYPQPFKVENETANSVRFTFPAAVNYVACYASRNGSPGAAEEATPYNMDYPEANAKVWFYNDETFFRMAEYTGDSAWTNCGMYVARAMLEKFSSAGPNSVQGYFYFPWTLAAAWRHTADPAYKNVISGIADAGSNYWGEVDEYGVREHAFAFERRLAKRAVTGEEDHNLRYYADATIAQLYENATLGPARTFNQPFMLGLAMRPLIRWYMLSHDERVPVVIKQVLDRFWDDWYDKTAHHYFYNSESFGTRCTNATTPFVGCRVYTSSLLNNLVSPAFAWYWRLTGDNKYRVRGDDLFSYTFSDGDPYSAKEWSQVYYWSWDFVGWRQGKKPAY